MDKQPLGNTGRAVTPLGFGAFKIGRNQGVKYPAGYALPDENAVERLLNGILDVGINYIDTAPAYGSSEERIGRHLAARRDEFVLSTKVGERFEDGRSTYDFSAPAVEASVEQSLRRLRTDVLDMVYIHAHADDVAILTDSDVVETLVRLRQRGWTRGIGLSGKTPAAEEMALEWADALMVEYHRQDRAHEPVMAAAHARGVAIVVKKGLASGHDDPAAALAFLLANPAVTSVVVGSLQLAHMSENVAAATRQRPTSYWSIDQEP